MKCLEKDELLYSSILTFLKKVQFKIQVRNINICTNHLIFNIAFYFIFININLKKYNLIYKCYQMKCILQKNKKWR